MPGQDQAHDFLEIDNRAELIKERDRMAKMMARVAEKKEGQRADVIDEQDIENIQAMSEIYADIFCFAPHFLG